jgi:2-dehydropantoate 2-reductase
MMSEHGASTLAFIGAGALGQAFAGLIAASGQPVTVLATPRSAQRLQEAGCVRLHGVKPLKVPIAPAPAPAGYVGITTDPTRLPSEAGLIFTTKAHQLHGAIAAVRAAWPPRGDQVSWVGGLQNGLVKDDLLAAAFGRERTVGAVTILSGQNESDGRISIRSLGMTYLGEFADGSLERVAAAAAILEQAGIPVTAADDIQSVLWSKACHAAGIFGVSTPTRASVRQLMGSPDLVRAYLALLRETAAIAAAQGIEIRDYAGFPVRTYLDQPEAETLATFAAHAASMPGDCAGGAQFPSMTQDLLAGRALEVDEVFGDLVERAVRAGLVVPRLSLIRDLTRGVDPGRPVSYSPFQTN